MKRIIKNNLVLIVVLGGCLVITIGLLVWTAMEYIQMSNYIAQTGQLRSDIATLIKKTPAPVEGNIPLIKTDTTLYAGAADKLRRRFGHPFLPALEQFISILRLTDGERISLAKFREDFMAEWSKGDRTAQKYSDYKSFQRRFRNWPEAMQAFRSAAEKVTTERITDNSIDEVFLSALGIPRQFDARPENLQRFMAEYRRRLLEITRDKVFFETPEAANFSFTIAGTTGTAAAAGQTAYLAENYPMIAQHWEILGDIVKRATDAGISSFVSFRKRAIVPEKVGGFDVFHYSIEITGTMVSIRKFVSLLDQAFQDNRVYVVRSIFLYQDGDGAQKLLTPNAILPVLLPGMAGQTGDLSNPEFGRRRRPGRSAFRPESEVSAATLAAREEAIRKAKAEEEEKLLPYHRRSAYGEKLIGKSDLCRAIIDVEYIMESGN